MSQLNRSIKASNHARGLLAEYPGRARTTRDYKKSARRAARRISRAICNEV